MPLPALKELTSRLFVYCCLYVNHIIKIVSVKPTSSKIEGRKKKKAAKIDGLDSVILGGVVKKYLCPEVQSVLALLRTFFLLNGALISLSASRFPDLVEPVNLRSTGRLLLFFLFSSHVPSILLYLKLKTHINNFMLLQDRVQYFSQGFSNYQKNTC